ncbi:MAG: septum site-determining protein MinD [Clostridia bacterium]
MARKIVITSGKGGVGKTTLTACLGYRLAAMGLRVALIDLDLGLNNLDVALNVENKVVFDLVDVIEGRCRVKQALIQDSETPSLYIMPSCHSEKRSVTAQSIKLVVNRMNDLFDYILIDCPAGVDIGFHRAVVCADEAIVVTTPHLSSIRDSTKVVAILNSYRLNEIYSVVNRMRGDLVIEGDMADAKEIFETLKLKPLGIVPEDDGITLAELKELDGSASLAYDILADNLHNGKENMYDCCARYKGVFGKIRRNLRRNA